MSTPFRPHTPEKEVVVKIKKTEADLIQRLRKYSYGEFVVHKADNILIRVQIKDSQKLSDDVEIDSSLLK